jgi:hypothetical protein
MDTRSVSLSWAIHESASVVRNVAEIIRVTVLGLKYTNNDIGQVRFQVLTTAIMKMAVFWDIMKHKQGETDPSFRYAHSYLENPEG